MLLQLPPMSQNPIQRQRNVLSSLWLRYVQAKMNCSLLQLEEVSKEEAQLHLQNFNKRPSRYLLERCYMCLY